MPLYYDATESRHTTLLPADAIEYGSAYPGLEELTGGDLLVVPEISAADAIRLGESLRDVCKRFKITMKEALTERRKDEETVLFEYLFAGSVIVQRKSGGDLISSIGGRLDSAIARMNESAPLRIQRALLYTGKYDCSVDGRLLYNGKRTNYNYWAYQMELTSFCAKGGWFINLPTDSLILPWIQHLERKLLEYKRRTTKWVVEQVYFPPDAPSIEAVLQLPIVVRDARKTLVTVPGWGIDRCNLLYEWMNEKQIPITLFNMLSLASRFDVADQIKGIGKTSVQKARKYLGLTDDTYLLYIGDKLQLQVEYK